MRKRLALTIFAVSLLWPWSIPCWADVPETSVVLLSPFHVVSSDSPDVIRQGIEALLSSRLSGQTITVTVLGNEDGPVSDADGAKAIAESRQGDYLIYGTVVKFGETLTLDAFLYDKAKGEISLHFHDMGEGDASLLKHLSEFSRQATALISGTAAPDSAESSGTVHVSPKSGGFVSVSLWQSPAIKNDIVFQFSF